MQQAGTGERLLSLVAIFGTAFLTLDYLAGHSLNHDTSWYLVATRIWLDGGTLYRDVVELNPPLMFYISALPLAFADLTGADDTVSMILFTCVLGVGALLVCRALLARAPLGRVPRLAILAAATAGVFVVPIVPFGQREHLFVILSLPWLTASALRAAGGDITPRTEDAMALVALPGLLLKPYCLLLPVAVTLAAMFWTRNAAPLWSRGNLIFGIGAVFYLGFILAVHPLYIEEVVPLAREVYGAYGNPWDEVLSIPVLFALPPLALALWVLRAKDGADRALWLLVAASLGLAGAYLVQFKGFAYHALPMDVVVLIAAVALVSIRAAALMRRPWIIALLIAPICLPFWETVETGRYQTRLARLIQANLPDRAEGRPIVVYSTNVWRAFPLVNRTGTRWSSRYPTQWLVPGAVRILASDTASPDRKMAARKVLDHARQTNVQDFLRHRPEIVIFDIRAEKSYFDGQPFDYLQHLSDDPDFLREWQDYRLHKTLKSAEIWVRG